MAVLNDDGSIDNTAMMQQQEQAIARAEQERLANIKGFGGVSANDILEASVGLSEANLDTMDLNDDGKVTSADALKRLKAVKAIEDAKKAAEIEYQAAQEAAATAAANAEAAKKQSEQQPQMTREEIELLVDEKGISAIDILNHSVGLPGYSEDDLKVSKEYMDLSKDGKVSSYDARLFLDKMLKEKKEKEEKEKKAKKALDLANELVKQNPAVGTDVNKAVATSVAANNAIGGTGGVEGVSSLDFVPGTTNVQVPKPVYTPQTLTSQTYIPAATNQTGVDTSTYGMADVSGTQQIPLQTASLSAIPSTVQARPNYTGTNINNLITSSQQGFGGQVVYVNQFGQRLIISVDGSGTPLTYVPPGFRRGIPDGQGGYTYPGDNFTTQGQSQSGMGMAAYSLGGDVQGQLRLANKFLGYQGEATKDSLDAFLNSNPGAAAKMGQYEKAMSNMAQPIQKMYQGGTVQGFSNGASVNAPINFKPGGTFITDPTKGFAIQYPSLGKDKEGKDIPGGVSQYYKSAEDAKAAEQAGLRQAGIPNYDEYLASQGVNPNLPGYDATLYSQEYNKYITNPQNFVKDTGPDTFTGDKFSYTDTVVPMFASAVQQTMQPTQAPVNYIQPMAADFIGSTAGQTTAVAPMAEAGTVANVTQSQMPQTKDAGAYSATGVAPDVAKAVEGGRTLRPQELLAAATQGKAYIGGEGPRWDEAKGKYVQGGVETPYREFTPEEFATQNNLNIGDFQTTYGQLQPAQGTVTRGPLPAQQTEFDEDGRPISAVTDLTAATQDTFKPATNEYKRTLTQDPVTGEFTELINGVADAQTAANFTEQIQASTATPSTKATVAGQLATLMKDFEGGDTPAWAAGSMRAATAAMVERGLGASSMAGQAIIQAAMESALPIAMADAQTIASFEAQNLSNKQQVQMLRAQQRAQFMGQEFDQDFQARVQNAAKISDIANMNFTADQTIQLENARAAQTLSLNNLSNKQAMVMAEAAALAGLDTQNLNNRQQAAVQNAQNFLQMDMANLTNEQQTAMFKTQQNVQALFTDQAAENASKQFNATSTNQTNQFFANLATQTAQFNAAQTNAMDQFNINAVNGLREFNSNIQQQRDMFNAQNGLVIAQANAQWRQNIATLNNATQNESNMDFAKTINGLTSKNLDEIWQRERDLMSFNFTSIENAKDRAVDILLGEKELEELRESIAYNENKAKTKMLFDFLFDPFNQT